MKVALYARVSSEAQAEKDLSIPAQLKELRKFAREQAWIVVAEYVDEAQSARTDARVNFQEMIRAAHAWKRAEDKPYDAILVWKFSRFARNQFDSAYHKKKLRDRGIRVISVSEKVEDSPEGKLLESIIEGMDEYFSSNLGRETLRGMKENASRGNRNGGGVAVGYKAVKVKEGRKEVTKIVPDEVFAPIVRRIFQMYLDGVGIKEIAQGLNSEGLRNKSGRPWNKSSISYILKNETYIGNVVWTPQNNMRIWRHGANPGEITRFNGVHEPIVDKEVFEQARRLRESKGTAISHPREKGSDHLLSGLLRCGHCGGSYGAGSAKSGAYHYYSCRNRSKKGTAVCNGKSIPCQKLDEMILSTVSATVYNEESFRRLAELANECLKRLIDQGGETVEVLDSQIEKFRQRLERIYEAYELGSVPVDELGARLAKVRGEIEALEAKKRARETLSITEQAMRLSPEQVGAYVEKMRDVLQRASKRRRKNLVGRVVRKVTIHDDRVDVEYIPPLKELLSQELGASSSLYELKWGE